MEDWISRNEHEEFCRRIDEENKRQNRRIELLEENELWKPLLHNYVSVSCRRNSVALSTFSSNSAMTPNCASASIATSVERLATSMESMLKEQERQGKRLETLENRDGEMWRKVVGYAVTFMVGAVLAFLFAQIGLYDIPIPRNLLSFAILSTLPPVFQKTTWRDNPKSFQ